MKREPAWNPGAALLLALPMAVVASGVFAWGQALPALLLLALAAAWGGAVARRLSSPRRAAER